MSNGHSTEGVVIPLHQMLEEEFALLQGGLSQAYKDRKAAITQKHTEEIKDAKERDRKIDADLVAELYKSIHKLPKDQRPAALCISGGGIRSATFGLGVLQGLAGKNLLAKFDYLSTVSGGGYVGSWLSAWIHRHPEGRQGVIKDLSSLRESKIDPEYGPIRWLREYSNYLTPQMGFLSADTWTWVAIYLRNLFLNWLILIPLMAAVLIIPRICVEVVKLNLDKDFVPITVLTNWHWHFGTYSTILLVVGFVLAVMAIDYVNENLPITGKNRDQGTFLRRCLLPLLCSAIALTTAWAWFRNSQPEAKEVVGPFAFAIFGIVLHIAGCSIYLIRAGVSRQPGGTKSSRLEGILSFRGFCEILLIILAGAVGGILVWLAATKTILEQPMTLPGAYVCLASPVLLTLFSLATTIYIGLASYSTSDADREWWARAGGWTLIAVVGWTVLSWLVIFGPEKVFPLKDWISKLVAGIGGAAGIITILLGKSSSTPATAKQEEKASLLDILKNNALTIAAPIFVVFIVIVISFCTGSLLGELDPLARYAASQSQEFISKHFPYVWQCLESIRQSPPAAAIILQISLLVFMVAVSLIMGCFVNANKFSLSGAYRDRIIRAYLGASQKKRNPNKFTGFDPKDNLPVYKLREAKGTRRFEKPLHVINIALNLVKGENLAWQERKAEPFTVTPLYSGSFRLGYRRSDLYGGTKGLDGGNGISLGTAVAISGAAASPNMGYHSSPVVTFLLALFNVRLGWWLGNPGKAGDKTFRKRGPLFAVWPLIKETFGLTDEKASYVYLSDGGHFENLGLYEMVLRRCGVIFVSDAGCDPHCNLEDLGNAIRKVRIDLGVPITFKVFNIYARDDANRETLERYAVGTIHYSNVDGGSPEEQNGILIYVKPAFYPRRQEPLDIFNYATLNKEFPHQATSDQWFTESQFESYRMLGLYTIEQVFGEISQTNWQGTALDGFFGAASHT
jgi:Patatin-like phospholipase